MEPYSDHTSISQPAQLLVPSTSQFKLALCQLTVTNDKADNLIRARKMLEDASNRGAKLAVLPEMWVCPYSQEYFTECAEELDGENQSHSPAYSMLSNVASTQGITIVGGSIPELSNGRLYNTCFIFGSDGQLKAKYRKLHLFDYDAGEASFWESDYFAAGDSPTVVDTDVGRIGVGICHDIRFPELAMLYKRKDPGIDLIIYPSAFNMSTGKMLWELEAKARAVDNQVFVAVCSPSRDSEGSYTIWGHSMIVGPSGDIKATAEHEENLVIAEIDYCENQLQRERFALHGARQDKIYQFLSK